MQIKLIKLSDDRFEGYHPQGINEGYVTEGKMVNSPTVGECFYVSPNFRTSPVTKIINEDTFKTLNSTYRIIKLTRKKFA